MKLLTVLFIALLACADLFAQVSVSGSVRGNVADNNKSAVSGASVKIINRQTNAELSTSTDEAGLYAFPRLAPGKYALIVEQSGFQRTTVENVEVTINEAATANVVLTVGEVSATVTVESVASILQSQTTKISALVTKRRVKELPLNGLNFQKLVLLAPGVGGLSGSGPNNPSINGARPVNNTYTIDGIGSNDERLAVGFAGLANDSNTDLGDSVPNTISTESIQEFRIITSNADATFGRAAGKSTSSLNRAAMIFAVRSMNT